MSPVLHVQSIYSDKLLMALCHGTPHADRARAAYEASSRAARAGRPYHHVNTDWTYTDKDYSQGGRGYTSRMSELLHPRQRWMFVSAQTVSRADAAGVLPVMAAREHD
jgi:hypothetical protein